MALHARSRDVARQRAKGGGGSFHFNAADLRAYPGRASGPDAGAYKVALERVIEPQASRRSPGQGVFFVALTQLEIAFHLIRSCPVWRRVDRQLRVIFAQGPGQGVSADDLREKLQVLKTGAMPATFRRAL